MGKRCKASVGLAVLRSALLGSLAISLAALPCIAQEPEPPVPAQEPAAPARPKEERLAEVRRILEEARKAAFTVPNDQTVARAFLFQGLVMAQADAGSISEALLTISAMGDTHPQAKASALGLVAMAQAREGDVTGALDTLKSLEREPWKSLALQAVVVGLAQQGYLGPALQFAEKIEDKRVQDTAFASLAMGQAMAEDFAGARQSAERIGNEEQRKRVGESIARMEIASAAGQSIKMRQGRTLAVVLGNRPVDPRSVAYKFQLPSTGMLVAAPESDDPGVVEVRDRVLEAVEKGLKEGPGLARESLRTAAALAADLEDESERDDHLWLVAVAQAELKEYEAALKTAALVSEGLDFSHGGVAGRAVILRSIGMAQAATGDPAGALRWAEEETDSVSRACALLGVAEGLLRALEREDWPGGKFPEFPKD